MDRFFAQNRLSALIDGVLSTAEAKKVERTVAKNAELATEHAAMLQAVELMHSAGPAQVPSGFQVRVMTQVETLPPPGGQMAIVKSAAKRVPMEAVALVALALVIGIVVIQRSDGPSEEVPAGSDVITAAPAVLVPTQPTEPVEEEETDTVKTVPEVPSEKPPPSKASEERFAKDIPARTPEKVGDPTSPSAYHILHGGDQVLFKIANLKDALGGRLVDGNGNTFTPHALTEAASFRRVFLVVPSTRAIKAHGKLLKMSGKMPVPVTSRFKWLRHGESLIMVEVQL